MHPMEYTADEERQLPAPRPASSGLATLAAIATMIAATTASAAINPPRSRFTTIDLKTCKVIKRHKDGNTWTCNGLRSYPVLYAEGDLRAFFSFGAEPEKRQAARQTLGSFSTIFERPGRRATVEWRFRRIGGADVPYATIMRLFTSRDGARGEVLVVTKVSPTEACHMAYIDAVATPEAMALARSAADEMAAGWPCANPPRTLGGTGRSPM